MLFILNYTKIETIIQGEKMSIYCEKCGGNWGLCMGCPPPSKAKKLKTFIAQVRKETLTKRIEILEKNMKTLTKRLSHLEDCVTNLEQIERDGN